MIPAPELPSPSEWGWKKKEPNGWEANWTTLPEATTACRELLRCGCKKVAEGSANVKKQLFSALLFVIVVDCALRINACTSLLDLQMTLWKKQ